MIQKPIISTKIDTLVGRAIEDWTKQGRGQEEIWAVRNFFSGRGIKLIKDIIREAKNE